MKNEEFGSTKLLKLKYRRNDQIIQTFCEIEIQKGGPNNSDILQNWSPPQKLDPPL